MSAVSKSVASAVANSTSNSVPVLTRPQLGPYEPMSGSAIIPIVPKTEVEGEPSPQPEFKMGNGTGVINPSDNTAPSVPTNGFLFKAPPIDDHYTSEVQPKGNPYATVGRPGTLGWWTRAQNFINGIATSQDTDNTGVKVRHPQQRTSHMMNALPPNGLFGTQTFEPHPQPQAVRYNRIQPSVGSDPYGTSSGSKLVLNSDTYGAGQTAGGIGGNQYTPTPGPPDQTSTAGNSGSSSMPVWG